MSNKLESIKTDSLVTATGGRGAWAGGSHSLLPLLGGFGGFGGFGGAAAAAANAQNQQMTDMCMCMALANRPRPPGY
jgi:hypothetical protein